MEEAIIIGLGLAGCAFFAMSLFSWRWTAFFMLLLSVLDLHLTLPLVIPVEPGVTIHGGDVFFVPVAAGVLLRLFMMRRLDGMLLLWLLFAATMVLAFVHGMASFGFGTAAASYRATLYLTVGVTCFATFRYEGESRQAMLDWFMVSALVVTLCALVLWLVPEWRLMDTGRFALSANVYERNRVLPAQGALFIGLGVLACMPAWLEAEGNLLRRGATLPLLLAAIFLYHRSVWVVLAVGFLTSLLSAGRRAVRVLLAVQGLMVVVALFWLLLAGLDMDVLSDSMRTAVSEVVDSNNSTLDWRIQGWRILVDRAIGDGLASILFGAGFGIGFERNLGFEYVTVSPHNYYIELFLTSGLVGCALYAMALLAVLRRMVRLAQREGRPEYLALSGILTGIAVYGGSYSPQYDAALLIGLALAISGGPRPVAVAGALAVQGRA